MKAIDFLLQFREKLRRRRLLVAIRRRGNMSDTKARSLLEQLFTDLAHDTEKTDCLRQPVSINITNMTGNINILCHAAPCDHENTPETP